MPRKAHLNGDKCKLPFITEQHGHWKILFYCWAINNCLLFRSYLQVSLDLIDEQTINLFFIYKIPSHATEVSRGTQKLILSMSVYIFIGLMMNLSPEKAQRNWKWAVSHGSEQLAGILPPVRATRSPWQAARCLLSLDSVKCLSTVQDLSTIPRDHIKTLWWAQLYSQWGQDGSLEAHWPASLANQAKFQVHERPRLKTEHKKPKVVLWPVHRKRDLSTWQQIYAFPTTECGSLEQITANTQTLCQLLLSSQS